MKIEAIYVACYRYDIDYARILVASIRHWYPDLPIWLVKDNFYGRFATGEFEQYWKVSVFTSERQVFGWGFGKLEPLFMPQKQRCLILDADTLFVGRALDELERYDEDFVVQWEDPAAEFVKSHYFDLAKLREGTPEFCFPGYTFNTGQFVATTGLLQRHDFDPWMDWKEPPIVRRPDIFKLGEQGLFNYVLMKKAQSSEITLRRHRLMEVPGDVAVETIRLEDMHSQSPHRMILHWCGLKKPAMAKMIRGDLLCHFERKYYERISFGCCKRWYRYLCGRANQGIRERARKTLLHQWWRKVKKPD